MKIEARHFLVEVLMDDNVEQRLSTMVDSGLMERVVPEFMDLRMPDGNGRHKDNLAHTIKVVAKCPRDRRVRLAAFFHDIGKPATRKFEEGKVTFYNHEWVGAKMTRKIMLRMGFGEKLTMQVARIVEMSGRVRGAEDWSNSAVRRFVSEANDYNILEPLLIFCYNDVTSKHQRNVDLVQDQVEFIRKRIREVAELDAEAAKRPPINGNQVMERYGLKPGPELGRLMGLLSSEMDADDAWAVLDSELT